jgi:hypothetical protein
MVYARDTNVSVSRTRDEIVATLERYGADAFGYASGEGLEVVFFRMSGRRVRLLLALPDLDDDEIAPDAHRSGAVC